MEATVITFYPLHVAAVEVWHSDILAVDRNHWINSFRSFLDHFKKENCQSLGLAVDLERQMLDCHAAVSQYLNLKFE